MGDAQQALRDVRGALTGLSNVLPRRAVLLQTGALADKMASPGLPEVVAVSMACECLRRAAAEPVYSRHTPHLLQQCLDTNDPGAWRALLDDATTGDLDIVAFSAFWRGAGAMTRIVGCMANATNGMHLWLVVRSLQHVLCTTEASAEAAVQLGHAFQSMAPVLITTLARRTKDLAADLRAGAISALGKLMTWSDIPLPGLASMLDLALKCGADDVLRLFLCAPLPSLVEHDPALVERLVQRAERVQ